MIGTLPSAERADIRDRERAAAQILERRTCPSRTSLGELGGLTLGLDDRLLVDVADDRHDQPPRRRHRDPEMDGSA